jgi:hypothetical protein
MKAIKFILAALAVSFLFSCEKKEDTIKMTIQGFAKNKDTKSAMPNMEVLIIAIQGRSSGMVDGSFQKDVGSTVTDAQGFFSLTGQVLKGAEEIKFIVVPVGGGGGKLSDTV